MIFITVNDSAETKLPKADSFISDKRQVECVERMFDGSGTERQLRRQSHHYHQHFTSIANVTPLRLASIVARALDEGEMIVAIGQTMSTLKVLRAIIFSVYVPRSHHLNDIVFIPMEHIHSLVNLL